MTALFSYQLDGAQWLAKVGRGLLADGMRVGKTPAAIRACDIRCAEDVLWLTTGTARPGHARAWARFQQEERDITVLTKGSDPVPDRGVVITSYDLAAGAMASKLRGRRWDAVIPDEAHRLKNRKSKRTQVVYGPKCDGVGGLIEDVDLVWPLSGTPCPNNPSEFWTHARAAFPEMLTAHGAYPDVMSYWKFESRYCKTHQNYMGHIQIVGGKNLAELRARMAPWVLRRTMAEVRSEVPNVTVDTLLLEGRLMFRSGSVEEEQAAVIEKALAKDGIKALADHAPHAQALRRFTGLAKVGPLVEWAKDFRADGGGKLVIFAYHREVIEMYRDMLGAAAIYGGMTPAQKAAEEDRFREDPSCGYMIGQLEAAGEAVDFSVADEMVFGESGWVPGQNDQAALRIVNVNKMAPTFAWFATIAGSIDEQIQRACARKLEDIRALFV